MIGTAAGLIAVGRAATADARHPSQDSSLPWMLMSLAVLVVAFALVWGVSVLLERRHRSSREPGSGDRD